MKEDVIFVTVQDQINEKNVCLIIKGGKMSSRILAGAMKKFLANGKRNAVKNLTSHKDFSGKGKQTVKQLVGQGAGVSNIEISDKNIKPFESIARKYGVDFALQKDNTEKPPKHLVFFKARDTDAIMAAFKEFSAKNLSKKAEKPSIIKGLQNLMDKVKNQVLDQTKHKDRGRDL
jgi:hypothetical protein